jgi:hypothetical protein
MLIKNIYIYPYKKIIAPLIITPLEIDKLAKSTSGPWSRNVLIV